MEDKAVTLTKVWQQDDIQSQLMIWCNFSQKFFYNSTKLTAHADNTHKHTCMQKKNRMASTALANNLVCVEMFVVRLLSLWSCSARERPVLESLFMAWTERIVSSCYHHCEVAICTYYTHQVHNCRLSRAWGHSGQVLAASSAVLSTGWLQHPLG